MSMCHIRGPTILRSKASNQKKRRESFLLIRMSRWCAAWRGSEGPLSGEVYTAVTMWGQHGSNCSQHTGFHGQPLSYTDPEGNKSHSMEKVHGKCKGVFGQRKAQMLWSPTWMTDACVACWANRYWLQCNLKLLLTLSRGPTFFRCTPNHSSDACVFVQTSLRAQPVSDCTLIFIQHNCL